MDQASDEDWDTALMDGRRPGYGRPTTTEFFRSLKWLESDCPPYFSAGFDPADPEHWEAASVIRERITHVGAEPGWELVDVPSHREAVPFDEPMLGIIGMWRQGGGANPHFALAVAETMLRTGQRFIAWTAYARAKKLAGRYSPDPGTQRFLVDHCSQRQSEIETAMRADFVTVPAQGKSAAKNKLEYRASGLQIQFEDELAFGKRYQQDYQDFESRQIDAGIPLGTPDFFDGFHNRRPAIASAMGKEETYRYLRQDLIDEYREQLILSVAIFGAGGGAMLPQLFRWLLAAVLACVRWMVRRLGAHA